MTESVEGTKKQGKPTLSDNLKADFETRRKVETIVEGVRWYAPNAGYIECPGIKNHEWNLERQCRLQVNPVMVLCFHDSVCERERDILEGRLMELMNKEETSNPLRPVEGCEDFEKTLKEKLPDSDMDEMKKQLPHILSFENTPQGMWLDLNMKDLTL